jgi:ketosteroid isomerase-like protein
VEPWELAAREEVRAAIHRYAHLVDRGRLDELLELFADDAILEIPDAEPACGHAAIREVFARAASHLARAGGPPLVRHHVSNVVVDVTDPAAATAESYFLVLGARGPDHWGRYRDRFTCTSGRWLFQHRRVRVDARARGSSIGFAPAPRAGGTRPAARGGRARPARGRRAR